MSKLAYSLALGLLGLCACSGKFASTGLPDAGDAGTDAIIGDDECVDCFDGGHTDGGPTGPCPESAPTPGTACTREGLECEYGSSQYPACDVVVQCSSGAWQTGQFYGGACPSGPNPAGCPASMADVPVGQTCDANLGTCTYALGQCTCGQYFGGPTPVSPDGAVPDATWSCDDPGAGCPQPRPRLGSACTQEGLSCMYLTCDFGQQCSGGVWQGEPVGCAAAGGATNP